MFQFMKDLNAGDYEDEFLGNSDLSYTLTIDETDTPDGSLYSAITEEEIKTAVRKLKNGIAPGYDNVVNEHISSSLLIHETF